MISFRRFIAQINPQIVPIVILSLLAHATLSGGRVVSSLFVLQGGNSEVIAGLTYGLYGLMPALLSLHIGRWVDHVGPKLVMRISLLVIVMGLLIPAFYLSVSSVLVCAAFSGLGFGGYILSAQTSVSLMKVEKESDRTGMFAWLQMGTSVSAVTGPILVGLIIDNNNFTTVYICLAGIVFLGLVGSFYANIPEKKQPSDKVKRTGIIQEVVKNRSLMKIYFLSMATYFAWDCFSFMIPVLGVNQGYSATNIGLMLSFFSAGTLVVRLLMPWLSRKCNELKTLSISYGLAAAVFFLLPIAGNIIMLCALSLAFGLLAGLWHPNIQNLILTKVGAERAGEASGLRLMSGNFSGMLGTTTCGALTVLVGFFPVFVAIAGLMGASSWQAYLSHRTENNEKTGA
ncbi:MFS transporter [Vibrio hippocampi]|uniref:Multidrug resistance protein MdtG n=1 Tax=Vibrio hippocampi TaxID=654686 RepID=A0ABN8DHW4_9VIBR|nr:MFS transporter [Vibrio hippocampi]CAH0525400.1 Multidrug resistance protein MdtG [Vibrio hippocampi]